MLLCVAGLYALARPWLVDDLGWATSLVLALAAGLAAGLAAAAWQSRRRRYTCPDCEHLFGASTMRHLLSQDWFGRVRCRCPACGRVHRCQPAGEGAG